MARYIDADKLLESLQEELDYYPLLYTREQNEWFDKGLKRALRIVKTFPTADVVPKSEVAKEFTCFVGDPHKVECCPYIDEIEKAKTEVAREIIDDILSKIRTMIKEIEKVERCGNSYYSEFNGGSKTALEIVFKDIAELKKKYTENENG